MTKAQKDPRDAQAPTGSPNLVPTAFPGYEGHKETRAGQVRWEGMEARAIAANQVKTCPVR